MPPPPLPSEPLLPVTHWQALFDQTADAVDKQSRPLSRSTDSYDFYNLSYYVDANISMFEATGEAKYADAALELTENMVASARPSSSISTSEFQDSYLGWTSQEPDVRGLEVALFESYAWRYVTRLLRVLRTSPLYADGAYRDRYEKLLAFTETNIFEKWYSRGADDFIYRSRAHMAAHWAYISLDLTQLTIDESRRARYREVVDNIDNSLPNHPSSLRAQLRSSHTDPMAFWWSDVWGEMTGPGQDIAHGNGVISYVVESRDLNAGWTADELERFARTLTSFVLDLEGDYRKYVDGSGRGNGGIADGFVKLGRYDPAVQAVLEDYGVQNSQYHAAMALNAKILGAGGG
ncbi:MAG: hypothetical protein ACRDSF_09230 [Pseudonocardiaceae bacterium]